MTWPESLEVNQATAVSRSPLYTPAYSWGRVPAIAKTLQISTLFGLFQLAIRRQSKR